MSVGKGYTAWYRIIPEFRASGLPDEDEIEFRHTWQQIQGVHCEEPDRTLDFTVLDDEKEDKEDV